MNHMPIIPILLLVALSMLMCQSSDDDDNDDNDDNDDADDDDDSDDDATDDDATPECEEFTDEYGVTWKCIPAGSFMMGCSPGDTQCKNDEYPRHQVNISAFMLAETEITQTQYEAAMAGNPSYHRCDACPVESVSWEDARQMCEKIGGRLPTEAEWEYAARADTDTPYYCGSDSACVTDIAWYNENASGVTQPVGQLSPNDFGLFDTLGNVAEWIADFYDEDYYITSPLNDPTGPESGERKVVRGGSSASRVETQRSSFRSSDEVETWDAWNGFRCARNVEYK